MRDYLLMLFFVVVGGLVVSQDPQYSQFYANPIYTNPGFTGNNAGNRFTLNYRNQWPAIPGAFVSYSAAYDANVQDLNSGVAAFVHYDRAGSGGLRFTQVGGAYSYTIRLTRKLAVRPAMSMAYSIRDIDFARLTFGDQLVTGVQQSVATGAIAERIQYMDVGAGGVLFSDHFWFGYSVLHLNQPNNSLLGDENRLPAKHSVHVGYNVIVKQTRGKETVSSLTFAGNYKAQKNWDQIDIGAYWYYKPFVAGVWYRGIPIGKDNDASPINQDAVVFMAGYHYDRWKMGYSYDITVSTLWGNTGGSHELSLAYEWFKPKRRKRRFLMVPCPSF